MNLLEKEDYIKLLEFSKDLNPLDIDFQEKTIQTLLQYFPFSGAAFPLVDEKGYYHRLAYANFNQSSIDTYNTSCYRDDFFAPANNKAYTRHNVLLIEDFMTFEEYETSALYHDVLSHNNFYYEALVLLRGDNNDIIGGVAVYHKKSSFGFSQKERCLLEEVGHVIEKNFRHYLSLYGEKSYVSSVHNLLYRVPIGMILCDCNFNYLQMNKDALRILEKLFNNTSFDSAQTFIKDHIIPLHLQSGSNRFCLHQNINLEVSIEHVITKDDKNNSYTTNYFIFLQYVQEDKDTKWLAYLKKQDMTHRECEIANLLRSGFTNETIANKLGISPNTVKRHKESIYRKLCVNRVNQLNILYDKI